MSYKVLARKWRPDHFDEVVGQGHVARTLVNSIEQDRVAHAYLFCGARGVGKTSTARILAKAMNCKEGPTPRPCYECSSCTEISEGQSVDVFEIDGASNRGINEIRELREGVRYAPSRDAKKIYIIDEVHMLTTEAFNALLKTLEEPPPHAIFIFATTEPQKIPVTILSRCQRFDFKRISQSDIVAHLEFLCDEEGIDADRAALQIIARQANGGMRDALSLLDQIISFSGKSITEEEITEILGVANRKHLFDLSAAALNGDAEQALQVLDEVDRYGYDLQQFASELVTHFRDLMVTAVVAEPEKVTQLTESELAAARQQLAGRSSELLHRYFSVVVDGAQKMHRSAYPKLVFEMTLVRLCELEPMENLDVLVERLALLESSLDGDDGPVQWPAPQGTAGAGHSPDKEKRPSAQASSAARQGTSTPSVEEEPEDSDDEPHRAHETSGGDEEGADGGDEAEIEKADGDTKQADEAQADDGDVAAGDQASSMPPIDAYEPPGTLRAADDAGASEDDSLNEPARKPSPAANEASDGEAKTTDSADDEAGTEEAEAEEADEPDQGPPVPNIPQPLRPVEKLELPDVDGLDSAAEKWRAVVALIRQNNAPAAATCEHGLVEKFEDGQVLLRFEPAYVELAAEPERRQVIEAAIKRLFGPGWTTTIESQDGPVDDGAGKTLAQEREEDIERRRRALADQLRKNPAVQTAQQLFEAAEPRISVKLYDE